nr:retrovirus-related Pol polyprotein from transposon TNT 1-94 [Tanacetum cinerariifolium]
MRPFECHVTILNTLDNLGKFDGKFDGGFFAGYLLNSKAFRVYILRTRKVEESLHIRFLEDKPNITGNGPKWLFDIDVLTNSMNYVPVVTDGSLFDSSSKNASNDEPQLFSDARHKDDEEVDMSNITTTYQVPTTPNTRIYKDHLLDHRKLMKTFILVCLLVSYLMKNPRRNKKDKRGIVIKNKARLVARGYTQEEGIYYDEVFAPIERIKAIRLFLAYASFMGFMVYQVDVKSAFLYGKIKEEVYVCQPSGFEDPGHPDKVYKVVKALYGLHQALRAWYKTLAKYLMGNGFHKGKIDQTSFIKNKKGDILLVQVYVDDIIFGSTKKELCTEFERLLKDKFQMSSIRKLTFFLGLQIESFIPMDTELVKGSKKAVEGNEKAAEGISKRAGGKLEQEDAKRQRTEEAIESVKLKRCLEIILDDDDLKIKATLLSSKSPTIVDYNIYKEGRKIFFKIIRADDMVYYLLVEKMYPFIRNILQQMWKDVRLQVDYEVEMAYDLLRLIRRQISKGYRTHTLIWRNKTDLKEQSLDDLFNNLKIYTVEVKRSSSTSTSTYNIDFVSSQNTDNTNEPVSVVASVSYASAKIPVFALPNVDSLSNAVIYSFFASQSTSPQLDSDDLKQIDADDLVEMDLKWQMAMLTVRARNLRANRPTSRGFDMSKVECYNYHKKGHFARECRSPKDIIRNVAADPQRRNVPVETSISNALVSYSDNEVVSCSKSCTNNTNKPVSAVASVSAASAKIHVFALSNVDTLNADDLEEMDLKWKIAMLTVRARECRSPKDTRRNVAAEPKRRNIPAEEEPTNYALMAFTSSSSSSFDNEVPSCSKACTKAYATLQSHYDKLTTDLRKSKFDVILIKQLRDNALVVLRQKFETAEQERDDLKLKLENSETDESLPASPIYDRYHSEDGYHVVPPPYTVTFMPPKPDLVFHDAPNVNEIDHTAFNVKLSPTKPDKSLSHTHRPSALIIEDWVFDSEDDSEAEIPQNTSSFVQPTEQVKPPRSSVKAVEISIPTANYKTVISKLKSHGNCRNRKACFDPCTKGNHQQYARMKLLNPQRQVVPTTVLTKSKLVSITAARPVTAVVLKTYVTRPRPAKFVVTKPHSPLIRHINRSQSPKPSNFSPTAFAAKAPMVNVVKGNWGNPQYALKDKGVIDSRCSRHMTGNMSYLSDFEELNGGYVAFGGNLKGGKIYGKDTECIVLSHEFKLPDENQVLLRVPRENNSYNVDLKNIAPSGDLTCLYAKATLDESHL